MFPHAVKLPFRVAGVEIRLDMSLFIVLPLFGWMIGANLDEYGKLIGAEKEAAELRQSGAGLTIGLVSALGLFAVENTRSTTETLGVGTRIANGCTSGHGVCGISRFSLRGIVATVFYIGAGGLTMVFFRHLLGVI